jgi:hypothetical protein
MPESGYTMKCMALEPNRNEMVVRSAGTFGIHECVDMDAKCLQMGTTMWAILKMIGIWFASVFSVHH